MRRPHGRGFLKAASGAFVVATMVIGTGCDRLMGGDSATPATTQRSAGGGGGAAGAGGGGGSGAPAVPVTVAKAEVGDVDQYVEEIGTTSAVEKVSVRAQVGGPLVEVRVRDGQDVKKGDVLFVIDKRPFEAALAEAKANLRVSEADLSNAKRDLGRLQALPQGAASAQDVDTAKASVERYTAESAVNQAKISTAELNLSYTEIASPINGRMGKVVVTNGNLVTAISQELADIRSIDPIYVDFSTPEANLPAVRAAMARGDVVVEVRVPGRADKAYSGKLTFVDNQVLSQMGQIQLRGTIDNASRELWPGMFVEVRIVTDRLKNSVLVPANAIDQGEGGARTYVVKQDGTAELRRVTVGQRHQTAQGERLVILQGIEAGETVVVKGRWLLGPGAKVKVAN